MLQLQEKSLDWALAHALTYGDTDVFPLPFEYEAIKHNWSELRTYLAGTDLLSWKVRPPRTLLSAKARYGFRVVTQLDPLDFLLFAAVIKEIGPELEASRIAADMEITFSYRFSPDGDGRIFDPSVGYNQCQNRIKAILADDNSVTHVVVADIADFYSRIYVHRLENALESCVSSCNHIKAIVRFLKGWSGNQSFGIPVGSAPVRLLAETTIGDVDQALLSRGIKFVRFNDDYTIVSRSRTEGYRQLSFLAEVLYENHGLTLNQQKTNIFTVDVFIRKILETPDRVALNSLSRRFGELVEELGFTDPYEEIDYDDLNPNEQKIVDSLNLVRLFKDQITGEGEPDLGIIRFVLRRSAQLGDDRILNSVLDQLDLLHPAFPDIIRYFLSLRDLSDDQRAYIGRRVLDLLKSSIISELDYHKMWALRLFTDSRAWDNEEKFFELLGSSQDQVSRRKLILAMGRAGQSHWFKSQWRKLFDYPAWPRRALLAGASCMPRDAHTHWYRSVQSRLDPLEKAVMKWAKDRPFG